MDPLISNPISTSALVQNNARKSSLPYDLDIFNIALECMK
ncbi:2475_t:CDS:2 [Funneliformis geosporum]|nr:2475_t:CDS:2 [Funneliformis geosporum]